MLNAVASNPVLGHQCRRDDRGLRQRRRAFPFERDETPADKKEIPPVAINQQAPTGVITVRSGKWLPEKCH
jgi:hypothetical protein